jgi:Xaa-Pro dipeptidase
MKRDNLDAIIATHPKNFEYLTAGWKLGFDPMGYILDEVPPVSRPCFLIVPTTGDPVALVASLFAKEGGWKELANQNGWVDDIRAWHGLPFKADYLKRELVDSGLRSARIGMELGEELRLDMPYVEFEALKRNLPKAEFVPSNVFWELRMIKSELEATKIRSACKITAKAFQDFFENAKANMTIREVLRRIYDCLIDAGAQRAAFAPLLGGIGLDTKTFRTGRVYFFDTAAVVDDYLADLCRMVVVGRATQRQRDMYEAVLKINDNVRRVSRPHATTRELWDTCIATMNELRVPWRSAPDRIGHGIGLMSNEPPSICPDPSFKLRAGNVYSLEPGIGNNREYYYVEEDLMITESGNEWLSSSVSRDLWEIPA